MGEALQLANLGGEPCVPNHVHSSTGVPLGMYKSKLALAKRLPTLGVVHGVHSCDENEEATWVCPPPRFHLLFSVVSKKNLMKAGELRES